MSQLALEYHNYRELKPTDDSEIVALFLFSLRPEEERRAHLRPTHNQTFWTEVTLSRDLASRGRWPQLSKGEKLKAMFHFAQESITEVGRKLRQAPMFWTPQSRLAGGPPWDLSAVPFPQPNGVVVDPAADTDIQYTEARKAAGLKSLGE